MTRAVIGKLFTITLLKLSHKLFFCRKNSYNNNINNFYCVSQVNELYHFGLKRYYYFFFLTRSHCSRSAMSYIAGERVLSSYVLSLVSVVTQLVVFHHDNIVTIKSRKQHLDKSST